MKTLFDVSFNLLKSLEYAPSAVEQFYCANNHLESIEHFPKVTYKSNAYTQGINIEDNPNLGDYQTVVNYSELEEALAVLAQKKLIEKALPPTISNIPKKALHKL